MTSHHDHPTVTRRPSANGRALVTVASLLALAVVGTACSGPRGVLASAGTTRPSASPATTVSPASAADPSSSSAPTTTTTSAAAPLTGAGGPSPTAVADIATADLPVESGAQVGSADSGSAPADTPNAGAPSADTSSSETPTADDAAPERPTTPGVVRSLVLEGRTRTWIVVAPPAVETTRPRPLVILLHGLAADGKILQNALGFDPLADGTDVVLAYPDAVDGAWNDERPDVVSSVAHREHVDDAGFLDSIIDDAVAADRVDANRVAVVGFSNGGLMASYYACVRAERVRAIAVVAGAGGAGLNKRCEPSRPVSVLAIHSRRDAVVPFLGGLIASDTGRWGSSAPVPSMLDHWRAIGGCQGIVDRVLKASAPSVTEQHAYGCRPGIEIVLERVESRVHGWLSEPGTFMTTDIVWQFVVEHTLVPA